MSEEFIWVAIAIVGTISSARATRLVTYDTFPPIRWVRETWVKAWGESEWATLLLCGFCFAMYSSALVILWGHFTNWDTYWWLFHGWMAMSYIAAIIMAHDGDDG